MNDFLNQLGIQRQNAGRESTWHQWSSAHHNVVGEEIWDTRGSGPVFSSIKTFLNMVPRSLFRQGIAVVAPPYLHAPGSTLVPGVSRSDIRFLADPENVSPEACAIWQQEGAKVLYLQVDRPYSEEGYSMTETFFILEDGRVVRLNLGLSFPGDIQQLYEGMAHFVLTNRL
jgi:hypothetical protein